MINFLDLKDKISKNDSAFCLFGNDGWVKQKAVSNICAVMGVNDDGFSVDKLDNPTVSDVILSCGTLSLFGDKRVVIAENFTAFTSGKADTKQKQTAKEQLKKLIAGADGSFCLIIICDDRKPFENIPKLTLVDCSRLDNVSIVKWIISYCKRRQVTVDRACAEKIADYCLRDMARIACETQKLIDYGEITPQSVELLVHKDVEYAIFDLSKHISAKNASKALDAFRSLVASGEDARALFGLLYSFYRRAYYVKISDCDDGQAAEYLGVKPAAIGFAKTAAEKYKPMQLKKALDLFACADARLRAFVDENEVMDLLIMQLIAL